MNPRTELEKRYPSADFSVYLKHLAACFGMRAGLDTQEHHICPRAQFPEFVNSPENKIVLKIDDHAFAHKLLSAAHPDFKKHIATWLAKGRNGNCLRGRKIGPHSKERLANIAKALSGGHLSAEHKAAIALGSKGKHAGEKNAQCVLTDAQVRDMREHRERGESYNSLAERFGVHYQTVYKIVNRIRRT